MQCHARSSALRLLPALAATVVAAISSVAADPVETASLRGPGPGSTIGDLETPATQPFLLDTTVNGTNRGVVLLLRDALGHYYIDAQTLAEWNVARPYPPATELEGRQYHALDAFPGLTTTVIERGMSATLTIPPQLLTDTRHSLAERRRQTSPDGAIGAYLDYDVAYTDDSTIRERALSSLLRPTVFTRRGTLSANLLYQSVDSTTARDWTRLDTTWTRDAPGAARTLRVGDAVTPNGSWARSVRFGGVQWGTNFAIEPDLVTFPQPSITGTAAVPSALDVLVNGTLRSRVEVPSGLFRIDDIPVVTGAGQIQVVARDLLGREQVITQDFYASERLLRPGLNDYSLSAGALRNDFGASSDDYGDFLVAGMLRRGLSSTLTIEGRLEGTADTVAAGGSVAAAIGRYGVASAALAISNGDQAGTLWQIGHGYQGRVYRTSVRVQGSSRHFVQPGVPVPGAFPKLQIVASGGLNLGGRGSLGTSYISERFYEGGDRRILTVSYSTSLPRGLLLAASVSHLDGPDGGLETGIVVSRALGTRTSASVALRARDEETTLRFDHRYELPAGPGFGYRTSVLSGDRDARDAEFAANTAHAHYSAELRRHDEGRGWRLQTRGSAAFLNGHAFAAREINDGFAVVDAGGFEGVRVYLENREIGTTNRHGQLLVPNLRPYEGNRLRVETADLPLTARIGQSSLRVAPYYRSGTVASFAIEASASAVLRVIGEDGTPVAEGARARVDGGVYRFPVGLDGRLYLTDVGIGSRVEIATDRKLCAFELSIAPGDAIAKLGDVVCRAVADAMPLRPDGTAQ
jgi:outer membrane usher protein